MQPDSRGTSHRLPAHDRSIPTIGVVDDDLAVRCAMRNLLEASGFHVLVFESGEAFLASPRLHVIDLAVLDIKLGGMDGFAIQQQCGGLGLDLPVLFISGDADFDMQQRALVAGALALLPKPVDPELLCSCIEDRLGLRQAPS